VKTGWFYKSSSFIYWWQYLWCRGTANSATMKLFWRCLPYYLFCFSYFGEMTFCWKFFSLLDNILLSTYHTNRYINSKICKRHVLVQWESLFFVKNCETVGTVDSMFIL